MQEVLVNRLGGLSLPRKSVVRLTDHPDMTLDVYHGRKQQGNNNNNFKESTAIDKGGKNKVPSVNPEGVLICSNVIVKI